MTVGPSPVTRLPFGKLDHERLRRLLGRYQGAADPSVRIGPRVGVDAAAIEVGGQTLVCTTDPITFATDKIGWYAVQVNANDVAVMGARPRWMQVCLLLPPCEEAEVEGIFRDLHQAAEALGVAVIGGHTEVTHGLDRPIVVGSMMGLADRLLTAADAQAGDDLILTKGIAIEGAAVIARELVARRVSLPTDSPPSPPSQRREEPVAPSRNWQGGEEQTPPFPGSRLSTLDSGLSPRRSTLDAGLVARAAAYLHDPGISVVKEALLAVQHGAHALHDPTEGGLLTGIWEMAEASGLGVEVDLDRVPLFPEAAQLCAACGLDIFRTLASGALLIAIAPRATPLLLAPLREEGIRATVIGRFVEGPQTLRQRGRVVPLEPSAQDELTKLL